LLKIKSLRKGLKIKAGLIFFSWLLIFAHGVVPHNHVETDGCLNKGSLHVPLAFLQFSEFPAEFSTKDNDPEACPISNILFHKFSTEENPVLPENKSYISSSVTSIQFQIRENHQMPAGVFPDSVQLRAPPLA
jgi:hypothetical protein